MMGMGLIGSVGYIGAMEIYGPSVGQADGAVDSSGLFLPVDIRDGGVELGYKASEQVVFGRGFV